MLTPMVDHLRWVESVRESRRIPAGHFALPLDWIAEYLGAQLDPGDASNVPTVDLLRPALVGPSVSFAHRHERE